MVELFIAPYRTDVHSFRCRQLPRELLLNYCCHLILKFCRNGAWSSAPRQIDVQVAPPDGAGSGVHFQLFSRHSLECLAQPGVRDFDSLAPAFSAICNVAFCRDIVRLF